MEQENAHAGVGEGDVRRQDQGVPPLGTVEAEVERVKDGGRAKAPAPSQFRVKGEEQVRHGQIKVRIDGLDKNSAEDRELFNKFQEFIQKDGLKGLSSRLKYNVKPGTDLSITRQMLESWFGQKTAAMTIDDFLIKYAHPDDLEAYNRVVALRELYDKLYKPRLP